MEPRVENGDGGFRLWNNLFLNCMHFCVNTVSTETLDEVPCHVGDIYIYVYI